MKKDQEAMVSLAASLVVSWVGKTFATSLAALREIFDEGAYARFLNREGMASSNESYAAFRREFEEGKARRPKCC